MHYNHLLQTLINVHSNYKISDIDLKTLRTELESGIRLSSPIYCPQNIWVLMQSCWKSDPNSRPSFKQLGSSLMHDIHFPKSSNNGNALKEEETIYRDILGDSSMKMRYNAICHSNNAAYLEMKKQLDSNKSEWPDCPDAISGNLENDEELKTTKEGKKKEKRKKEAPKRNTIKVFEKENGSTSNLKTEKNTIYIQDHINHCANNTYLIPNILADVEKVHECRSSATNLQEKNLVEVTLDTSNESEEKSMLIKYNTLPLSKEHRRKSSLSLQDESLFYESTSRSYETTYFEDDTKAFNKTNNPKPDKFQNIEDIFRPISTFWNSSKRNADLKNNDIIIKKDKAHLNHSSENIDESVVYNFLSRKRIKSCDTPSTQYTGVDLDDRDAESKYHQAKLLNRMKSLEEVEEDAFIEFDLTGFE